MSRQSKLYGEIVDAFEGTAAASFGCLAESASAAPASKAAREDHLAVIAFLEQLRAQWDLDQSSLYDANRSELEDVASLWKVDKTRG